MLDVPAWVGYVLGVGGGLGIGVGAGILLKRRRRQQVRSSETHQDTLPAIISMGPTSVQAPAPAPSQAAARPAGASASAPVPLNAQAGEAAAAGGVDMAQQRLLQKLRESNIELANKLRALESQSRGDLERNQQGHLDQQRHEKQLEELRQQHSQELANLMAVLVEQVDGIHKAHATQLRKMEAEIERLRAGGSTAAATQPPARPAAPGAAQAAQANRQQQAAPAGARPAGAAAQPANRPPAQAARPAQTAAAAPARPAQPAQRAPGAGVRS